jgi:uncharacterized cupredoxin-like copper-binding protein
MLRCEPMVFSMRWLFGVLLVLVAAGCGQAGSSATPRPSVIDVSERDFAVAAPKTLPAGDVVLRVHNKGPDAHELIVVRAPDARLPMRSDGLTVDEESLQRSEAGVLEPAEAPAVRDLPLHLTPGRYVLFCNMSGHFIGGMHRLLVVR